MCILHVSAQLELAFNILQFIHSVSLNLGLNLFSVFLYIPDVISTENLPYFAPLVFWKTVTLPLPGYGVKILQLTPY